MKKYRFIHHINRIFNFFNLSQQPNWKEIYLHKAVKLSLRHFFIKQFSFALFILISKKIYFHYLSHICLLITFFCALWTFFLRKFRWDFFICFLLENFSSEIFESFLRVWKETYIQMITCLFVGNQTNCKSKTFILLSRKILKLCNSPSMMCV